jgi:transposase
MKCKRVEVPKDVASLSHQKLVELVRDLLEVIKAQQDEIEKYRRAGKRQAAPFSRERKKGKSKKPGRKPGKGTFTNRQPPALDEVTEHIDVPSCDCCPDCGSSDLELDHYEDAYTTYLPEPKAKVKHFRTAVCHCRRCGCKDIRGRHPELPEDQRGATANRVDAGVFIAAHVLHYGYGVPVRKTPAILKELTGVEVTQSAITQDAVRRAQAPMAREEYQRLRNAIQQAPVAQTDDTGYRLNGEPAQLMVFATPDTSEAPGITVYQIRRQHRNEEVREVIPGDYEGVMVTDRGRS